MNTNIASQHSTADIRAMLTRHENPRTLEEALILRGAQAELGINPDRALTCGNISYNGMPKSLMPPVRP